MPVEEQTRAAVLAVLDAFGVAYGRRDLDAIMALFIADADLTLFGTGADERRMGSGEVRSQIQRDFDQSEAISITWGWRTVAAMGNVAWVAAEADAHARVDGREFHLPLRFTWVCERRGASWLVAHVHLSSPTVGQEQGQSFPA